MKALLLTLLVVLAQAMPKNDPNGIWRAESGSEFEFRQVGSDIEVEIVPDSNPRYLTYELQLEGTEEPNTYKGSGRFKAKLQNGRECEFDTEWQIVVVSEERIIGVATQVFPDPDTCAVVELGQMQVDLTRKQ